MGQGYRLTEVNAWAYRLVHTHTMEPPKRKILKTNVGDIDVSSLRLTAPANGIKGSIWVNPIAKSLFKDAGRNLVNEILWEVENTLAKNERLTREGKSE